MLAAAAVALTRAFARARATQPLDGADGEDGGAGAAGEGEAGEGEEALGVPLQSEEMHAATALHPGTI